MIIVGFHATAPSRGRGSGKEYRAVACSDGTFHYWHGPAATPTSQGNTTPHHNLAGAIGMLRNRHAEKVTDAGAEYTVQKVACIADVPDNATREQVLNAFQSAVQPFGSNLEMMIAVAQASAAQAATTATTTAPPAARRRATTTAAPTLTLPAGEVFTRPNGETYLPRLVAGQPDVALLRHFRQLTRPLHTLLIGLAGTGKTAVAEAAFGGELVTIGGHGDMTEGHLVGQLMPTPEGGWEVRPGPLTIAMENGWPLLIDEINKLPMDLISVIHSATDGRGTVRFEDRSDNPVVHAKPGFFVVGTLNPDAMGSNGLPEAITSRFGVQITVTTDWDAARTMGVPHRFVTVAENLTSKNALNEHGRTLWVPQMRELLHAKALVDAGLPETFAAAAMLSQCPYPEDVPVIADLMRTVFGATITNLTTGSQVQ